MRKMLVACLTLFSVVAAGCGLSEDPTVLGPDASGEILIDMTEFSFNVDVIEVTAGETVTFVLVNAGANEHEFMIGRNIVETTEGFPNGFEHDFFETITPFVDPPSAGMDMGAMDGMDMGAMDMGSMDMGGDAGHDEDSADMEGMDMGSMDMSGDAGHDEDSADMEGMDMGGDAHSGYMVQRQAGEVARLTVTIADDVVGEWEIGCFRGRGSHWDAGMRATLIVRAA